MARGVDFQCKSYVHYTGKVTTDCFAIGPFRGGSRLMRIRWFCHTDEASSHGRIGFVVSRTKEASIATVRLGTPIFRGPEWRVAWDVPAFLWYGGLASYMSYLVEVNTIVREGPWWLSGATWNNSGTEATVLINVVTEWPIEGGVGGLEVGGAGVEFGDAAGVAGGSPAAGA